MDILFKVWGPYACFTRPEFSTERKSYDIITPSAARNILTSIYWHPGITYRIQKIWVRKPIRFINIRRNEVSEVVSAQKVYQASRTGTGELYLDRKTCTQQRMSTVLRDVEYYILAKPYFDRKKMGPRDTPEKLMAILSNRLDRGACFNQPYLGTREFPAFFERCTPEEIPPCPHALLGEKDMGVMLYDMDYDGYDGTKPGIEPILYHPIMKDGCVEVEEL